MSKGLIWIQIVMNGLRFVWFILWLFIIIKTVEYHELSIPIWGLLLWLIASYLIPEIFTFLEKKQIYFVTEMLLTGGLYFYLVVINESNSSIALIPLICLGFYYSKKQSWWIGSAMFFFVPIIAMLVQTGPTIVLFTHLLNNMMALGVGFVCNRLVMLVQKNQKQMNLIQEQKKVVEQYAKQVETLTLHEERNRMAGELHDTIGHTFTSVIVGMDGVQANLKIGNYEKASQKLDLLRGVLKNGLGDIRNDIHHLGSLQEDESFEGRLETLINEFKLHTSTEVNLHITATKEGMQLSYNTKHILLRCLQEALTNAKRHGNATSIHVFFRVTKSLITLKVQDNGAGVDNIKLGFGLMHMKERINAINGSISLSSSKNGGFTLEFSVPNQGVDKHEKNQLTYRG